MTPAQIIGLARDVAQCLALGFIIFWIYRSGGDRVKLEDVAAVQKQTAGITKAFNEWQTQDAKAKGDQYAAIKALGDRIDKQRSPIVVRVPAPATSPVGLPGIQAGRSPIGPPAAGRDSSGSRADREEDLRPEFNRIEMKYSKALAECRRVIATCKVPK